MYHLLPSQVSEQATTFDIMVTDVYSTWEKYKMDPSDQNQYRVENLQEILEKTRK